MNNLFHQLAESLTELDSRPLDDRMHTINELRKLLHEHSPMKDNPVDLVLWVKNDTVYANDYNPNSVAPPELKLLEISISHDGFTSPIVSMQDADGRREVIDGFHRHRVGKESAHVREQVKGYLPVVQIRSTQTGRNDRIASTIRHNRARGKHHVEAMSDIVIELKRRNWSDDRIARELGMDADEVLRLCQITGLAEAFTDTDFSAAWEAARDDSSGAEIMSDVLADFVADDKGRVYHTWEKWEVYRAGFYAERPPGKMTQEEGEAAYAAFLGDLGLFRAALEVVVGTWPFSCEHFLTNDRMNRIAWLGQAAMAQATGVPSTCRGGYHAMSQEKQLAADELALEYLNRWLVAYGREATTLILARGRTEMELY